MLISVLPVLVFSSEVFACVSAPSMAAKTEYPRFSIIVKEAKENPEQ